MVELTEVENEQKFRVEIDKETAQQFAIILSSGCPASQALLYFEPDLTSADLPKELKRWVNSGRVKAAIISLQGGPWEGMSLQEKLEYSITKHYSELAFFLYNTNYNDLTGPDRAKADICRGVIEAKLAGMAGKVDAMSRFFEDVMKGVVGGKQAQPFQS